MSKLLYWFLFMVGLWTLLAHDWGILSQAPITIIGLVFFVAGVLAGIYSLLFREKTEALKARIETLLERIKSKDERIAELEKIYEVQTKIIVESIKEGEQGKQTN